MSDLIAAGGSLSYAVLGLGGIGALIALALGGLAFTKRRVPLAAFALVPLLVALVGAVAAVMSTGDTYAAVAAAQANDIAITAMSGMFNALSVDILSRWAAAFALAACAWGAALGSVSAGDDTQTTLVSGVLTALATLGGAVVIAGYGIYAGVGGDATTLAALFAFGGLGVTVASFRRALDEQSQRVAGMRFTSAICMFLSVMYGGRALVLSRRIAELGPEGAATKATDMMQAIGHWNEAAAPVGVLAWVALGLGAVVVFFSIYNELGEIVERFTLLDVFAVAAVSSLVGVARVAETSAVDGLMAIGTHRPVTEMYKDFGPNMHAASLTMGGAAKPVAPVPGGFGDVLVYKDEKVTRTHKWTGAGWEADATDLASATLSDLRPLVVIGGGDEASYLMEILQKAKDGKALLALRASEAKSDIAVPPELAHLQVAFLEVELAKERDLTQEVWQISNDREFMWGPIYWYGDTDAEEPAAIADAVAEATQAKGLHVVLSEHARVKDIANSCLNWIYDASGDSLSLSPERWCRVTTDSIEDVRIAAAENWELPNPENTSVTIKKVEGDQVDEEIVKTLLLRELGAIDFCVNLVREEGEQGTVGKMLLELWVNSKGQVGTVQLHEKTKLDTAVVARCAAMRFKRIEFPWPEDWEPPEVPEGEEPPPMPHYELEFDFREPKK